MKMNNSNIFGDEGLKKGEGGQTMFMNREKKVAVHKRDTLRHREGDAERFRKETKKERE